MKNQNRELNIKDHAVTLLIACVLGLMATHVFNFTTAHKDIGFFMRLIESPKTLWHGIYPALIGMGIIYIICMLGLLVAKFSPFYLPTVAWISLVAVLSTSPISPCADFIMQETGKVGVLALTTPILAYAGLAIGNLEIDIFKRSGWKIVLTGIFVFIGTFIGSALVSHFVLKITGA